MERRCVMHYNANPSGLEIWPPTKDDSTSRPECVKLPVGVFNPPEVNSDSLRFQVFFICGGELGVDRVETQTDCRHAIDVSRYEDGQVEHRVEGDFELAPREFQRFYVTFCRKAPFQAGEIVAFSVRVVTAQGVSERNLRFRV